ncbi:hypothetical protein OG413_46335 [Streptomyces sp. NBC_01433]|uniref:hypothetical protein n=1 Tax=Streptomyces sp. NBC_01433 TaxID=2903864 RepID=UPI002252A166|nr:hypothetical protein [Streptomyces sp. NBC_01433]MCX4682607.1 hypothetical protein [Streptomyces sp. NBC_01433]
MEHKLSRTEDGQTELTIRWNEQEDDPMGFLYGWVVKGHLESFLRTFPRPGSGGSPVDAEDAYRLALGLNWLAELTDRRLELLLLLLRDQYKASWGTLGAALDASRSTAKSRYQKIARQYAECGNYVDETGIHSGPPAEVKQLVETRLRSREDQDRKAERAVAKLKAGDRVHYRLDTARQGTAVKTALGQWVIDWDDEGELLTPGEDIVPLG